MLWLLLKHLSLFRCGGSTWFSEQQSLSVSTTIASWHTSSAATRNTSTPLYSSAPKGHPTTDAQWLTPDPTHSFSHGWRHPDSGGAWRAAEADLGSSAAGRGRQQRLWCSYGHTFNWKFSRLLPLSKWVWPLCSRRKGRGKASADWPPGTNHFCRNSWTWASLQPSCRGSSALSERRGRRYRGGPWRCSWQWQCVELWREEWRQPKAPSSGHPPLDSFKNPQPGTWHEQVCHWNNTLRIWEHGWVHWNVPQDKKPVKEFTPKSTEKQKGFWVSACRSVPAAGQSAALFSWTEMASVVTSRVPFPPFRICPWFYCDLSSSLFHRMKD